MVRRVYLQNQFIPATNSIPVCIKLDRPHLSSAGGEQQSDAEVARILVERSERTPAECAAFNAAFRRRNFDFVLLEADEGRLRPGLKSAFLKFTYNNVIMPVVYRI